MAGAAIERLAAAIGAVNSPEHFYPLAAHARAVAADEVNAGKACTVHLYLLGLARQCDEPVMPERWQAILETCRSLAAYLRDDGDLDVVAKAYLSPALQDSLH